jgi:copper chaperone
METRTLNIQGMSCGHCVARVNKTLAAVPGVTVEDVQVGSARVTFDPARTPLARIGEALADAGYPLDQNEGR